MSNLYEKFYNAYKSAYQNKIGGEQTQKNANKLWNDAKKKFKKNESGFLDHINSLINSYKQEIAKNKSTLLSFFVKKFKGRP